MTIRTLPDLLLAPTAQSWGDERERAVMLQAYAYVFLLAQFVLWTVGAVIAWFIPAWVTIVLFLAFLIPSIEWQRFTKARDVDANTLIYTRDSLWRTASISAFFGMCALSMALSIIVAYMPDDSSSAQGAVVGGICGVVAAIGLGWWTAKRKAARSDDLPDED